jgi:hypothetical protein
MLMSDAHPCPNVQVSDTTADAMKTDSWYQKNRTNATESNKNYYR